MTIFPRLHMQCELAYYRLAPVNWNYNPCNSMHHKVLIHYYAFIQTNFFLTIIYAFMAIRRNPLYYQGFHCHITIFSEISIVKWPHPTYYSGAENNDLRMRDLSFGCSFSQCSYMNYVKIWIKSCSQSICVTGIFFSFFYYLEAYMLPSWAKYSPCKMTH